MKTVAARLSIEVLVDCPQCDCLIDLTNEEDTAGVYHNDDGGIIRQACPDGIWIDEHSKFKVEDVECSQCGTVFNVKELEW